ncbi:MAG: hypothetical protein RL653_3657 [Pseudomonadota bacterium]|jgi:streptogramin lyase
MRSSLVVLCALAAVVSLSGCSGCGQSTVVLDGGTVGGRDGGGGTGGGSGGGSGTDGGALDGGGPVEPLDAGAGGGVAPGSFSLDAGNVTGEADGVTVDPNGHVVLSGADVELHAMWIANASEGTVSRYDTRTGKEEGRYVSAFPRDGLGQPNGLTGAPGQNHSPSRTAIDLLGDMWVANRAPGGQGSVTKIAGNRLGCVDRNGNGVIDTSTDLNGDGAIQPSEMIVPTDWSLPEEYDECILFTQPLGSAGGGVHGRAIAISTSFSDSTSAGVVWVANHEEKRVYRLDAQTGAPSPVSPGGPTYVQLGFGPYGAAVDGQQRLWLVDTLEPRLALVDTQTGTLVSDSLQAPPTFAGRSYGIAVDGKGRVWLAGWISPTAMRYDHGPGTSATPGTWTEFDFGARTSAAGTTFGRGRGIAVDEQGWAWMSASYSVGGSPVAHLIAFNSDTGAVKGFPGPSGTTVDFVDATDGNTHSSIGVGLDGDGNAWINNYSGNAVKVDRTTGAVLRTAQQSAGLYTYSDFTGYQLRRFTAPRGTWRQVLQGCGPNTKFLSLDWSAQVPTGTGVAAYVRSASSVAGLAAAQRFGPFSTSPADLQAAGVPNGSVLQVEFLLTSASSGGATPVLQGFHVSWSCESVFQ